SVEVLRRVRQVGYAGGKSALYGLVASLRPKEVKPLVRFEGLPGEFSQHDFGQVDVEFRDGSVRRIRFFASRLKYSRWVRDRKSRFRSLQKVRKTEAVCGHSGQ